MFRVIQLWLSKQRLGILLTEKEIWYMRNAYRPLLQTFQNHVTCHVTTILEIAPKN